MNIIDLIIVLIILVFMLIGSLRGFISSVVGLVEYILSIFLAYKFSPYFANFLIEKWAINEKINSLILSQIPKIAENLINNNNEYKNALELSGQSVDGVKNMLLDAKLPFLDTISNRIVQILAMIILFIALKFVFKIISVVLNRIAKLPILNSFNKIGGMIVGFIEGSIISIIMLVIISFIPNNNFQEKLNESLIGNRVSGAVVSITVSTLEEKT